MENKARTKAQARGCIQLGDLAIFAFGSFIMFAKTADVLGAFAPANWFGFSPADYGIAAALLIEGFLVWRKVKSWLLPPDNFVEWGFDFIVTITPFALSVVAQVVDGYLTTGILMNMTEETKRMITAVVSILVTVPLLLDIIKTTVENAPAGIFDDIKTDSGNVLQDIFGWMSNRFSGGNTRVSSEPVRLNQDTNHVKKVASGNNHRTKQKAEEPTDP